MNGLKYTIKSMPEDMRPREKVLKSGEDSLTDSELLAIVIRQGSKTMSALELANHLLIKYKNIRNLKEASLEELMTENGIGRVKAVEIKAALELGRRISGSGGGRHTISGPEDVSRLFMEEMRYFDREHLRAIYLDTKGGLIGWENVSIGGLASAVIHPREVFKPAVKRSAASVILVHNHPSGDPAPSSNDIEISKRIAEAGNMLGISLFDHIIIGDGRYCSLKAKGLI